MKSFKPTKDYDPEDYLFENPEITDSWLHDVFITSKTGKRVRLAPAILLKWIVENKLNVTDNFIQGSFILSRDMKLSTISEYEEFLLATEMAKNFNKNDLIEGNCYEREDGVQYLFLGHRDVVSLSINDEVKAIKRRRYIGIKIYGTSVESIEQAKRNPKSIEIMDSKNRIKTVKDLGRSNIPTHLNDFFWTQKAIKSGWILVSKKEVESSFNIGVKDVSSIIPEFVSRTGLRMFKNVFFYKFGENLIREKNYKFFLNQFNLITKIDIFTDNKGYFPHKRSINDISKNNTRISFKDKGGKKVKFDSLSYYPLDNLVGFYVKGYPSLYELE